MSTSDGRPTDDFPPTASLDVLRLRSDMLDWLRGFFRDHGYWEVQTPQLSHDVCVDVWLEPFAVPLVPHTDAPQYGYLQTSPEFAMKRLLASGAEAIFQVTSAFRQGESGPRHNPEFTIVEWYRVGDSYHDQMAYTERLTREFLKVAEQSSKSQPAELPGRFVRVTYDEAFQEACGQEILEAPTGMLRECAASHSVKFPASLAADDRDGWLNLLLAEVVEPWMSEKPAVFLYDYPATQAALSRIRPDSPPVAERFELYLSGLEICNGYQELTDPVELRRRIAEQSRRRHAHGLPELPKQSRLLVAMEAGLPECSGVALGFDRLLMAAIGGSSISEVMAFPFERA